MGRSILKFSAEVVPRRPFGPKTAKKWKTPKQQLLLLQLLLLLLQLLLLQQQGLGGEPPFF